MVLVGAFARINASEAEAVKERLNALSGVETFDLDDEAKVGLIIEEADLDQAHAKLTRDVGHVEGVLAAWPVYLHHDETDQEEV